MIEDQENEKISLIWHDPGRFLSKSVHIAFIKCLWNSTGMVLCVYSTLWHLYKSPGSNLSWILNWFNHVVLMFRAMVRSPHRLWTFREMVNGRNSRTSSLSLCISNASRPSVKRPGEVGEEILPLRWRSSSTSRSCSWVRWDEVVRAPN